MSQIILQGPRVSHSISECFTACDGFSQCITGFHLVSHVSKDFRVSHKSSTCVSCLRLSHNVSEFSTVSYNVLQSLTVPQSPPKCLNVSFSLIHSHSESESVSYCVTMSKMVSQYLRVSQSFKVSYYV